MNENNETTGAELLNQKVTIRWKTNVENKPAIVTIQLAALLQELGVQITENDIQQAAKRIIIKR